VLILVPHCLKMLCNCRRASFANSVHRIFSGGINFCKKLAVLCLSVSISMFVCLLTRASRTNHIRATQSCTPTCTDVLMNSHHKKVQQLDQSDLVYWVYRSSCAASWASQTMGCLCTPLYLYSQLSFCWQFLALDTARSNTVKFGSRAFCSFPLPGTLYQPISVSGLLQKVSEDTSVLCLVGIVARGASVANLVNCCLSEMAVHMFLLFNVKRWEATIEQRHS